MSNDDVRTEFESAVAVARQALVEFRKEPLVASKRGSPDWQPIVPDTGPQRNDYKNAAQFCKADREFLGEAGFRQKYGGGNAHGKCVSGK
jgi:hypothetical protein